MTDDDLARRVSNIWSSSLGSTNACGNDNFFVVGGHSMLGIRMMAALSTSLGTRLPIRLLFNNPTLDELTRAIAASLPPQGNND